MVISHNISALNTYKSLGIAGNAADNSMEKLSSGYKINKAADDAAGLSISEKMRSQIRGLNQASTNAENGVSMIQTAEGALNESHSILQRMRELAVQAATDTNASEDRQALQSEMEQLTNEVNRISNTTEFNGMKILNGDKSSTYGAVVGEGEVTLAAAAGTAVTAGTEVTIKGAVYEVTEDAASTATKLKVKQKVAADASGTINADASDKLGTVSITNVVFSKAGVAGQDKSVYFHVGANSNQVINTSFDNMSAKAIGISFGEAEVGAVEGKEKLTKAMTVNNGTSTAAEEYALNISNREGANNAISVIDAAIKKVSNERSKYGAIQNRLEYTINNLNTTAENMTAAESTIRDVDMADEMMEYTKNNILQQAAQAMLVQANARPQQALQLLQ